MEQASDQIFVSRTTCVSLTAVKRVIHWFRRDLRVSDNTALHEAARSAEMVIPVFILEDAFKTGPDVGAARAAFLLHSVDSLRKNLEHLGYPLVIRLGKSVDLIPHLARELKAEAVFCNARYEPYAEARDQKIAAQLESIGVPLRIFKDAVIWERKEILTKAGSPYTVFTPYAKAWKALPIPSPKLKLKATKQSYPRIASDALPLDPQALGLPLKQTLGATGERAAMERLKHFLQHHVYQYGEQRNYPSIDGTSQLSPHLRCGTIGIRTILAELEKRKAGANAAEAKNCDIFLSELIWREFYTQILANFPHVSKGAFRPEYDRLKWSDNETHYQAWCAGMTGFPIVDAAMRCLNSTGNMHNRLRMITAMFLTKDLLINWQRGERYFMQQLVDGDKAANNGGWQWSAGTGTDAAPYFRIFNPVSQGEKFDVNGDFVRQWIPELKTLPSAVIHQPWEYPLFAQTGYVKRIVDHSEQREKCLAMFKAVKS